MGMSYVGKSRLSAVWTSLRYMLQSVQFMLLVGDAACFLQTKFVINFNFQGLLQCSLQEMTLTWVFWFFLRL
mgnify:CR=1 FL=1